MTDITNISTAESRSGATRAKLVAYAPAVVLVLAVAARILGHLNADVSWLLTLSDKILDGATLYVDFIETNPPASISSLPARGVARRADRRRAGDDRRGVDVRAGFREPRCERAVTS